MHTIFFENVMFSQFLKFSYKFKFFYENFTLNFFFIIKLNSVKRFEVSIKFGIERFVKTSYLVNFFREKDGQFGQILAKNSRILANLSQSPG